MNKEEIEKGQKFAWKTGFFTGFLIASGVAFLLWGISTLI
ncbi:hypothetical protein ES703_19527 [subsurface metagenome]